MTIDEIDGTVLSSSSIKNITLSHAIFNGAWWEQTAIVIVIRNNGTKFTANSLSNQKQPWNL